MPSLYEKSDYTFRCAIIYKQDFPEFIIIGQYVRELFKKMLFSFPLQDAISRLRCRTCQNLRQIFFIFSGVEHALEEAICILWLLCILRI